MTWRELGRRALRVVKEIGAGAGISLASIRNLAYLVKDVRSKVVDRRNSRPARML